MEIIKEIKTSWKLIKETNVATGQSRILSGYGGDGRFGWPKEPKVGFIREECSNIVFCATIAAARASRGRSSSLVEFEDRDGLHTYQTGTIGMFHFFKAIQEGRIVVSDGWLIGTFTFAKQGKEIYLQPYG